MNHAQTLIEVTKEYTLRPRKHDRINVLVAAFEYLLNNFTSEDIDESGYEFTYVDTSDIKSLLIELKQLTSSNQQDNDRFTKK